MKLIKWITFAAVVATSTPVWAQENTNVKFPNVDRAWLKGGTFVNVEQLRRIGHGMTPNQIRELISYPHFNEGFALSNWNYIFNFRTGQGEEYVTCQYQIQFKDGKSNEMYWKDQQCEAYVRERPKAPAVVTQTHPVTLSADGMFAFDESDINGLQAKGRENLRSLVAQMKSGYHRIHSIMVTGYTDRLGSTKYNQALSLARANTVKHYFVSQGLDANVIQTKGMGSESPVINCPGPKTGALIACLLPNRRIEVVINGEL